MIARDEKQVEILLHIHNRIQILKRLNLKMIEDATLGTRQRMIGLLQ